MTAIVVDFLIEMAMVIKRCDIRPWSFLLVELFPNDKTMVLFTGWAYFWGHQVSVKKHE